MAGENLARAMAAVRPVVRSVVSYERSVGEGEGEGREKLTSYATAENEDLQRGVFCEAHVGEGREAIAFFRFRRLPRRQQ